MPRKHITITERQNGILQRRASRLGISFSEALRRALDRDIENRGDQYLERKENCNH